jgi:hypothetical protein
MNFLGLKADLLLVIHEESEDVKVFVLSVGHYN